MSLVWLIISLSIIILDLKIKINISQDFHHPDNNPSVASLEENKKIYGVKVVGSFIGTPEFIRNNLDLYFQDLEVCANKLMNHNDLQERMILFRDSFIKKPLHIFRTINPIFTQEFASKFECLKIKILCSILGFESSDLSDLHYKIAQLSIKEGGLGLQDHWLVGKAAFVASAINFHRNFEKLLTADSDLAIISNESFVGQFISLSQLFCGVDKYCTSVFDLLKIEITNSKTVQGILTEWLHKLSISDIKVAVKNKSPQWYKWFNNLTRGDGACGKWLESLPIYEKFRMNSMPFRICLRHRMFLPTINLAHGAKCVCKDHPVLDPYGHHLASGCFIGGYGSNTHYSLVREFNNILHYGGLATRKEEKNIFVDTIPNHALSDDKQRGLRTDISVLDYNGFGNKLCLDVTVTSTMKYHNNGAPQDIPAADINRIGKQAEIAYQKKMAKYDDLCKINRFGFLPIVFESNGFLHAEAINFLHQIANNCAADKGIPTDAIFNYFLKGLSFSLQKSIANAIQYKLTSKCTNNSVFNTNAILSTAEVHV